MQSTHIGHYLKMRFATVRIGKILPKEGEMFRLLFEV
jgi:hypothetical protein